MANPFLVLGGIAVGVVAATFGILQVPGWVASAQDASVINDLTSIRIAQATESSTAGSFSDDLDQLSRGDNGTQFTLSSDRDLVTLTANPTGSAWCAVIKSASGSYIAASNSQPAPKSAETAQEALDLTGCDLSIPGSFTLRIDTRAPGCTAPGVHLVSPDARIRWGDGATTDAAPGVNTHEYTRAGAFDIRIEGTIPGFAELPAASAACITDITVWENTGTASTVGMFKGAHNLATVVSPPATVTDMSNMFEGIKSAKLDLRDWNVTAVKNFSGMFNASTANPEISKWITKSAVDMSMMFKDTTAFNADLSAWHVETVTTFDQMFMGAKAFDQDISRWNTESARYMRYMFQDSVATADLSGWNVQRVSWYAAFAVRSQLTALPNFRP